MSERLEPVMHVVAVVPAADGARVAEALLRRRGRILSREPSGEKQIIRARVPLAGMMDFWPELSGLTGGRGTFSMVAYEYHPVREAPPPEPEAGVREPRPARPGGRHGAVSIAEPEPESGADAEPGVTPA
jgi:translation elongation factor EF-G